MKTPKIIVVLFNTPQTRLEADADTQQSAVEVAGTLEKSGFRVELVEVGETDLGKIDKLRADLIFNLIEWAGDHTQLAVEALEKLEKTGIAFTGSSHVGYRLSCDKAVMKRLMDRFGITTPTWQIFETGDERLDDKLRYPMIVKPSMQHCGVGLAQDSVVSDGKRLRDKVTELIHTYKEPILVEEYIEGRELHVTVLEKNGRPWVLPPAEVTFKHRAGYVPILSYDMKWDEGSWEYGMAGDMAIPKLPADLEERITSIAKKCYEQLDGRDYPRLDLRIKNEEVFVLEINNNPGIDFATDSGIGASARAAGFGTYGQLLEHIVTNAYARFATKYDTAVA